MSHRTHLIIAGALLTLVVASLACSASGDVSVEGPVAGAQETPAPTEPQPTEPPPPDEAQPSEPPPPPATDPTAPPPTAEPDAPATEAPTEEPPPPPPPPSGPPPAGEPLDLLEIPELGAPSLDPRDAGMGHLGTFRQRMTASFTADATGVTSVYHYDAEVNTADQAVHFTLSVEGPVTDQLPSNQGQAIWIGPKLWIKLGNRPWIPIPENVAEAQFDEQMVAVGDFLPYVPQAEYVGDETVNSIPSAHYTYDVENVPTQNGTVSGQGHIYVAQDGGYVVRYTFDGTGTFEAQFQGSGALNLVYDTYDVGAGVQISSP